MPCSLAIWQATDPTVPAPLEMTTVSPARIVAAQRSAK